MLENLNNNRESKNNFKDAYKEISSDLLKRNKQEILALANKLDDNSAMQTIRSAWNKLPDFVQYALYKNPINDITTIPLPIFIPFRILVDNGFLDYKGHKNIEQFAADLKDRSRIHGYALRIAEKLIKDPETQAFLKLITPIAEAQDEIRTELAIELKTHLAAKRTLQQKSLN